MADDVLEGHEELLASARRAAGNAYAPYSGFLVGSALRCRGDGALFIGCNVENASYGLSLCAERSAAVSAVSAGRRDFDTIAVYSEGSDPPVPCGACCQFLAEFNPALRVVVSNGVSVRTFLLSDLLPLPFGRQADCLRREQNVYP